MVAWIAWVIWGLAGLYCLMSAGVMVGVRRLGKAPRRAASGPLPFVTVLVAARDEEQHIEACLESLLRQEYPSDRYEVVVVNDRSVDGTPRIIAKMAECHPNLSIVEIVDTPEGVTGKQNALRVAVPETRGEFVLNTDADCVVPPTWVSAMVERFGPDVGLVMGLPTTHEAGSRAPLLARVQSLDLAFLLHQAIGAAGWGSPASCIGNNLAYRRSALDEIGGYDYLPATLTEDALLVRTLHEATDWKVAAANCPEATILTQPAASWGEFYQQRARWVLGGLETQSPSVKVLYGVLVYYWVLLLSPLAVALAPALLWPVCVAVCTKLVADLAVAWQACARLSRRDVLRAYLPFSAYYLLYASVIGLTALISGKVQWKGQMYERRR